MLQDAREEIINIRKDIALERAHHTTIFSRQREAVWRLTQINAFVAATSAAAPPSADLLHMHAGDAAGLVSPRGKVTAHATSLSRALAHGTLVKPPNGVAGSTSVSAIIQSQSEAPLSSGSLLADPNGQLSSLMATSENGPFSPEVYYLCG